MAGEPKYIWLFGLRLTGEPLPKERPRAAPRGGRSFTPQRTRDAEKRIRAAFAAEFPDWVPVKGVLRLDIDFYRATRRTADRDNLEKLVSDALNGVAFVDDKQLVDGRVRRFDGCGDRARTEIRCWVIEDWVEPVVKKGESR